MPHRQNCFVVQQERSGAIRIERTEVSDIVPVRFQPAHHGILCIEYPGVELVHARVKWPVVADLISTTLRSRTTRVQVGAAVIVISFPGRVGGLEQNVRSTGIIADDKEDMTRTSGVGPNDLGKVNTGSRI